MSQGCRHGGAAPPQSGSDRFAQGPVGTQRGGPPPEQGETMREPEDVIGVACAVFSSPRIPGALGTELDAPDTSARAADAHARPTGMSVDRAATSSIATDGEMESIDMSIVPIDTSLASVDTSMDSIDTVSSSTDTSTKSLDTSTRHLDTSTKPKRRACLATSPPS
jgi:hypothetical protein